MLDELEKVHGITEANLKTISKYLTSRLAANVIITEASGDKPDKQFWLFSEPLNTKHLGVFSKALKKCIIKARCWKTKYENSDGLYIDIGLQYDHYDGGSNGCELCFDLFLFKTGAIIEIGDN